MKKQYVWIYVLPILMMTTTLAFGVLGVRSAANTQAMNTELAKVDWKMEPVSVLEAHWPQYEESVDVLEVIAKGEKGAGKYYFSSDAVFLDDEAVANHYEGQTTDVYWTAHINYGPEPTKDGQEIMMDASGERVGTVIMKQIDDWTDKYVCGEIGGGTQGILDYDGKVVLESEAYTFDHLYGELFYKRPWYGKGADTTVFNIETGEVLWEQEGDWLISGNCIGFAAENYIPETETDIVMYFDGDFRFLTKVENGMIQMGPNKQNVYWQTGQDGSLKLLDENLKLKADYGDDVLAFTEFQEGLSLLYYKDKLVCLDEDLNVVFEKKAHIPPRYADHSHYDKNSLVRGLNEDGFRDGIAVFTLDGCHYGVLDKEGNVLLEPVFKGDRSLTVMKNRCVAVFYEQELRIGAVEKEIGGVKDE